MPSLLTIPLIERDGEDEDLPTATLEIADGFVTLRMNVEGAEVAFTGSDLERLAWAADYALRSYLNLRSTERKVA